MITFRFGHSYTSVAKWPRGYAQDSTSRAPKFESCERNIFVYSLCLSFGIFYLLFCLGVRCLFVFLFFIFAYGHSKQTMSLLLLEITRFISLRMHGLQSVAFIIGF